jgi:hypothetical protein
LEDVDISMVNQRSRQKSIVNVQLYAPNIPAVGFDVKKTFFPAILGSWAGLSTRMLPNCHDALRTMLAMFVVFGGVTGKFGILPLIYRILS